jgi:hypothetical protein
MEKEMMFNEGERVGVPCTIQPGPFADEKLITVEAKDGPLSGFANQANLLPADEQGHGFVKGIVVQSSTDSITVKLFGSFFTTALGMASVRRNGLTRIAA